MPDNIANPSNIATLIGGIMESKNRIKTKLLDLGLAAANDSLYDLSYEITDIANNGAISATVQEGTSYTIPAGYHNGAGVVTGISGGGNYQLQAKGPITPTKSQQQITSDEGYYGLSGVTIDPIPDAYQDVSSVTAQASQVLATKIFVNSAGNVVTGTMTNNGAVNQTISVATPSYTIPSGYHDGSGKVSIVTETKSATPSISTQDITPTSGKVLSKVTVAAIPSAYQDVTGVTATASQVLAGASYVTAAGVLTTGTMINNGAVAQSLSTSTTSYTIPQGYHNGSGTVSITTETKSVTPSANAQTINATAGKVISSVTVGAIPSPYYDVSGVTAAASQVLAGTSFVTSSGTLTTGTMTNVGAQVSAIDGLTVASKLITQGYHDGTGYVYLTNDIEIALSSI